MLDHLAGLPHIYVVFNPVAGTRDPAAVRATFARIFGKAGYRYEVYETTGSENLTDLVQAAAARQPAVIAAAGGDGTIAAVASALQDTDTPLGIIPVGTANVLAQELGISLDLEQACRLLVSPHRITRIDAMQVDGQRFFLQIGIGIDSLTVRDTSRAEKRRLGKLAYLRAGTGWLLGHQPVCFTLRVDGKAYRVKAAQISIVNGGSLGIAGLSWGPDIRPDDGQVEVCIIKAQSLLDYGMTLWQVMRRQHGTGRRIRYIPARQRVIIDAERPIPAQGDGELIETLPLAIEIVPAAVQVVVPPVPTPATPLPLLDRFSPSDGSAEA